MLCILIYPSSTLFTIQSKQHIYIYIYLYVYIYIYKYIFYTYVSYLQMYTLCIYVVPKVVVPPKTSKFNHRLKPFESVGFGDPPAMLIPPY